MFCLKMKHILLLLYVVFGVHTVFSANILFLCHVPSPSHHYWNRAMIEALAAKGHNVTSLAAQKEKNTVPGVHYLTIETIDGDTTAEEAKKFDLITQAKERNVFFDLMGTYSWGEMSCTEALMSKGVRRLYFYPNDFRFDLIIYDFTLGPCLLGFYYKFGFPPLIAVSAFGIPPYYVDLIGGHTQPAYIPHYDLDWPLKMNFFQRAWNGAVYWLDHAIRKYYFLPHLEDIMDNAYRYKKMPPIREMEKNTSLMFLNIHPAIDYHEPLPPNVIPVGGLQIREPKPLPTKIRNFIESSQKGTILVSLGTNVQSNMIGKEGISILFEAFRSLPEYNFIWKFETSNLFKTIPENILILSSLPQNDILGFHGVKAFVSHCGQLSIHEAAWFGVPVLAIPFFIDQNNNFRKLERHGAALKVTVFNLTVDNLRTTLLKLLETPSYSENMVQLSKRFKDQPENSLDRAIWWIEWILRNPDASHMKSPALNLNKFQSNMYDIILTFLAAILFVYILLKRIIRRIFKRRARKTEKRD